MSNTIKHCQSATPESYESVPTLEGLTSDQYKLLTEEHTATEEKYEEAVGAHDEWKAAKAKEVDEKEYLRLADLKQKVDAMAKKKQDDLQKKKVKDNKDAVKRLQKELKKKEKAVKAVESDKGKGAAKAVETMLVSEERGTDGDTEGEKLEASKEKALQKLKEKHNRKQKVLEPTVSTVGEGKKRKQPMKSTSVVEESREDGVLRPSKKAEVEVTGPAENVKEL
ncbi:hypothetical protein ARMSODRAFT_972142 [Armillaria solidipes]|uniref:Uncharacterized protein n=1 Tax=Armillaria solidipes TaxID=1076256 RepID=A0A2H3BSA2_9AGAR|nr:hypothetical protein ARMSODRAFT_972142 [Armillaria solidipes]